MLPTDNVKRLPEPATQGAASTPTTLRDEPTRVVLDTNTVLDWLVFGEAAAAAVGSTIASGGLAWLTTPRMHAELRAVLSRPLPPRWDRARELALTIDVSGLARIFPEPEPPAPPLVCRDASDQVFIDLARQHSPAVLLTRDRALLALRRRAAAFGVVIATASGWRALAHTAVPSAAALQK